jgi:Winged helix-turn helix/DDE superfamily endonuclease
LAAALGFETGLWTSWRVAHLIEHECGVHYHPSQAWRILRRLGWSCQRPVGRALERDEEKIRRWKRERWPEIKKKAQNEERTIVFVDESGLSERPHCCRTWAPRGQTPVLQYHFNWKTLSAMARVRWWNFYFRLFPGAIRSPQIIEFLSHLLRHIPGKLLIVWDGLPGHRSRDLGVYPRTGWAIVGGVSPCLCAGTESGGISLVALEAARVAQLLSPELWALEQSCSQSSAPHAPATYSGDRFLATSGTISVVTILCNRR